MARGDYDFVREFSEYETARKVWYVEVLRANCFWYDLIVDPPEPIKDLRITNSYLSDLKRRVEAELEKRFIYFFCSRPRIRFDVKRKPSYELFGDYLKVYLLVGKNSKRKTVRVKWVDEETNETWKPECEITDKLIRFHNSAGGSATFSVHDFLDCFNVDLGHSTKVHYVGITKNPETRPLNRQHRGVADTLYRISNEENDFFLVVNLFKVTSIATNDQYNVSFMTSNAVIDEINVDAEGSLIEKALIAYFDSPIQCEEQAHERSNLAVALTRIKESNHIESVIIDIEFDQPNEYLKFSSERVDASYRHVFSCSSDKDELVIEKLPMSFDYQQLKRRINYLDAFSSEDN